MTCRARTYTHTHKHTYSEETEESLFYFSVVLFHILLGSKIGGFQYEEAFIEITNNTYFGRIMVALEEGLLMTDNLSDITLSTVPARCSETNKTNGKKAQTCRRATDRPTHTQTHRQSAWEQTSCPKFVDPKFFF